MVASASKGRFEYLDSIRGIAALIVLLHHALISMPKPDRASVSAWIEYTPLRLIEAGRPAVILFFVLSGFVLTASIHGRRVDLGIYMARRFVRIYAPFVAAIAFSIILFLIASNEQTPTITGWLGLVWQSGVTPTIVADHLMMLGRQQDLTLNPVVWSLWYELRISLVLPILVALVVLLRRWVSVIATVVVWLGCELVLRAFHLEPNPITAETVLVGLICTLHFVPMFAAGALLFINRAAVSACYARLSWPIVALLWIVAFGLVSRFQDLVTFPGTSLLLALCISSATTQRFLELRPLVWLGRISFSLYLTHVPLLAAIYRLDGLGPHIYLRSIVAAALSLVTAELFYRAVERPTILWNKRIKRRATAATGDPRTA